MVVDQSKQKLIFKKKKKNFFLSIFIKKTLMDHYYVNEQYSWIKKIGSDISSISTSSKIWIFEYDKLFLRKFSILRLKIFPELIRYIFEIISIFTK